MPEPTVAEKDVRNCIKCGVKLLSVEQGCFCTPCLRKMGKLQPPNAVARIQKGLEDQ